VRIRWPLVRLISSRNSGGTALHGLRPSWISRVTCSGRRRALHVPPGKRSTRRLARIEGGHRPRPERRW